MDKHSGNRHSGKGLLRDRRSAVAVYVGVVLAVVIGIGGLALDLGRLFTLNTELKNAVDYAALAGAAELDGSSGARTRAAAAAEGALISNTQTFAAGAPTVAIETVRFLRDLPPDDQPIDASYEATGDGDARFIEVTCTERSVPNFLIRVVGGPGASVSRELAVAGYTRAVCNIPPLAVCNPDEAGGNVGAGFDPEQWRGKQVLVKASQRNAAWTPGDFGLVDTPEGRQSAKAIAELLASARPNVCVSDYVDLKPGATQSYREAFNTRLDMYENPFFGKGASRDPKYRPAKNVTKGLLRQGQACNYAEPVDDGDPTTLPPAMGLPRDENISKANRFGNGEWNRADYWAVNHPGVDPPPGYGLMSRYQVYRYEVEHNPPRIPDNSAIGGEDGNPQCYSGPVPTSDDPDRRIVYFAVINCVAEGPIRGNSAGPIKVTAFVKALLTEPVGDPPNPDLYLEIIDVARAGDGVLHDIVQLYR